MKKRTGILGVLIAILILGIGYAAISSVNLIINGTGTVTANPDNFKVVYTAVATGTTVPATGVTVTPASISADGDTTTSFTVTGLSKLNDEANLTYTITNKSPDLNATLGTPTVAISGTNASDYFEVTSTTAEASVAANGGTTTQTVKVKVKKTPISDDVTGTFTITVVATPAN